MSKHRAFTPWGTLIALAVLIMMVSLLSYPGGDNNVTGAAIAIDFGYGNYGLAWAAIVVIFVLAVYMEFFEGKKGEKTKEVLEEKLKKAAKEIKKQI